RHSTPPSPRSTLFPYTTLFRSILRRCIQQFQTALADRNHHKPYLLLLDGFFRRDRQPQLFIDRLRRRQRLHSDPEMIDFEHSLEIGRASCRERVSIWEGEVVVK